jgi:hypothetical protein
MDRERAYTESRYLKIRRPYYVLALAGALLLTSCGGADRPTVTPDRSITNSGKINSVSLCLSDRCSARRLDPDFLLSVTAGFDSDDKYFSEGLDNMKKRGCKISGITVLSFRNWLVSTSNPEECLSELA